MAKWMSFLLAGGVAPSGQRLINRTTLATIFSPQFSADITAHESILEPYFPGSSFMPDYGFTWYAKTATAACCHAFAFTLGLYCCRHHIYAAVSDGNASAGICVLLSSEWQQRMCFG